MAATKSAPKKPLSYAFSYGFLGGPLHARKFKRLMNESGFVYTLYTQKADIIIAHSAGTWLIPTDCNPKLVMYIGTPLNQKQPRKTLHAAGTMALKKEKLSDHMRTRTITSFYTLMQPRRNLGIFRIASKATAVIFSSAQSIFIANQHDPWPTSDRLDYLIDSEPWAFIGLRGTHNDVWQNSDRYVEIIKCYAGLLA